MTNKVTIKHTCEEADLICEVKKFGTGGAHILLPKILIGEKVSVYYPITEEHKLLLDEDYRENKLKSVKK